MQPINVRSWLELVMLGGGWSHFLWKKLREITEMCNCKVILCFKWYGVVEIARWLVFFFYYYYSLDDESKCKNMCVKMASFMMPGRNKSFAVNLNVIRHIEGGEHQLTVWKLLVLAGLTVQSIVQNKTKSKNVGR